MTRLEDIDKILVKLVRYVEVYIEDENLSQVDREGIDVAVKEFDQLIANKVIEELENIVKTAPVTPLHRDDRYYFDIGYEIDKRIKTLKGEEV